ncbi:phosphoglucomutase [Spirochaetia bacterium 38H-sp]|uniref:Phosphoglucomutase n=1 Tax=Rarispira pelagica TaxID=3141764 RepID=A0ABU9UD12_9SPIR
MSIIVPKKSAVLDAMESFILSVSGWRKVFAASGLENDLAEDISPEDMVLAFCAGRVFADFFATRMEDGRFVVLGRDTRHTGDAIARCVFAGFLEAGVDCRFIGITAAPEIMALSAVAEDTGGFVYVSASHNPPGHNGIKAGYNGGVLDAEEASSLIEDFKILVNSLEDKDIQHIISLIDKTEIVKDEELKNRAKSSYLDFISSVICGFFYNKDMDSSLSAIKYALSNIRPSIIGELNGSSRALSIDRDFLESLGCSVFIYNNIPGDFAHDILPEGESLALCAELVSEQAKKEKKDVVGYVPDCDGDRGNLVFADQEGNARILDAQEVFALAVLGELAFASVVNPGKPLAVVANGPTSMRIEEIAEAFDAQVIRVEVGEAHVTGKAVELIKQGYVVPILGEGSNGGSIVPPARVRDPLATIGSILKLIALRDEPYALFKRWCKARGINYKKDFSLSDVLASLPAYTTSTTGDNGASLRINTKDMSSLKERYQNIFADEWEQRKNELASMGIYSYHREIYLAGNRYVDSTLPFSLPGEKGGFKMMLKDKEDRPVAFMWMRKSGTEPVFRILVDAKGDNRKLAEYLFNWQRNLIKKADSA